MQIIGENIHIIAPPVREAFESRDTAAIQKLAKAHYVLMNIECGTDELNELESAFRFNDAVLRNMIISRKAAVTDPSLLVKRSDDRDDRGRDEARRVSEANNKTPKEEEAPTAPDQDQDVDSVEQGASAE